MVCGAGPAAEAGRLVALAHARDWLVDVLATPAGLEMADVDGLEAATGSKIRSEYRRGDQSGRRDLPKSLAVLVAPATFNTVCKLAAGINDTYALGIVAEAIGRGLPVRILPFVNTALAGRAPFQAAVRSLRAEGVSVHFGPGLWQPHPPGTGADRISEFPWEAALDACIEAVRARSG